MTWADQKAEEQIREDEKREEEFKDLTSQFGADATETFELLKAHNMLRSDLSDGDKSDLVQWLAEVIASAVQQDRDFRRLPCFSSAE